MSSLFSKLLSICGIRSPPSTSVLDFIDPLGNFKLSYPSDWKFNNDIVVDNNCYSVTFESKSEPIEFTIFIDLNPISDFAVYAKDQLDSPKSGIYATSVDTRFRNMPAYEKSYTYASGSKTFFGYQLLFFTKYLTCSISWTAPEISRTDLEKKFKTMLSSLVIIDGHLVQKKKRQMLSEFKDIA